jgi:hypothetical protein
MNTPNYDLGPFGNLLSDMKFQIRMNFIDASVVFAPRGCNKPAHELAALGVGLAPGYHNLWMSSYPTSITRLVAGDLAVS